MFHVQRVVYREERILCEHRVVYTEPVEDLETPCTPVYTELAVDSVYTSVYP